MAIATANKLAKRASGGRFDGYVHTPYGHVPRTTWDNYVKHRDMGGALSDPSQAGIGGVMPSAQSANPLQQQMIQRYASLPTEKLHEMAGMMGGNTPQGQIIEKLLQQRQMQPQNAPQPAQPGQPAQQPGQSITPPQQTSGGAAPTVGAAPMPQKRGGATPKKLAAGGMDMGISPSQGTPWWTRQEAEHDNSAPSVGFLHGPTPGRADALNTTAPAGSYVVPADVVSGLGEGNSLAGARKMTDILNSGPHGIPMPRASGRTSAPHPPPLPREQAKGGGIAGENKPQPVLLSHGEHVVTPEECARFGNGDVKAGHEWFDKFVVRERAKIIAKMKSLPGPVGAKKS